MSNEAQMAKCQNIFTLRTKIGDDTFSALGFGLPLSFELKKRLFVMLLKNPQMQGSRNPEGGVATNKERLLATPASW